MTTTGSAPSAPTRPRAAATSRRLRGPSGPPRCRLSNGGAETPPRRSVKATSTTPAAPSTRRRVANISDLAEAYVVPVRASACLGALLEEVGDVEVVAVVVERDRPRLRPCRGLARLGCGRRGSGSAVGVRCRRRRRLLRAALVRSRRRRRRRLASKGWLRLVAPLRHPAVEAGRDDGDPDLVAERVVDNGPEVDVGLRVRCLRHVRSRLVDLE